MKVIYYHSPKFSNHTLYIDDETRLSERNYSVRKLREEVDDFLDEITVDYEKMYKENTELRAEIERTKEDLERYKNIEQTLQNTLVMAQKTADDIKNNAQDEADGIIRSARSKMQDQVDEITKELDMRRREYSETKKQFDIYRAKMEALLISQLELLKDMKED